MGTIAKALKRNIDDIIFQGDIFENVKYSFIVNETDENVDVLEFEFPYAIVISQCCDVNFMSNLMGTKKGKVTKFMPTILMCPIYDDTMAKTGEHIDDAFKELGIIREEENLYNSSEKELFKKDHHYRFHSLNVKLNGKSIIHDSVIDFKHVFSVPITYLLENRGNRVISLEDIYSEQITLKFANFLSRVAMPEEQKSEVSNEKK